jgi:TetR/AcrR family transcriptional repressor of mexJK operon
MQERAEASLTGQLDKRVRARVPGRPTQQAALRLREICLDAALAEFVVNGFQGTTIDGIARRAKASRATVYRMFGNKEALFRAVHQWVLESRQSDLRALLGRADVPVMTMLAEVIEKIASDSIRPRDLALTRLFVAEAHRFPELVDSLFEHSLFEPLINYLGDQKARGALAINDPVEAAWDLAALASGGIKMLIKPADIDPAALQARVHRVIQLLQSGWLRSG